MYILSNLATSLDGKIATASREFFPLGTPADRKEMVRLRGDCDAVLMGASTIRVYQKFCGAGASVKKQPANVILSSTLDGFSPEWPFFTTPDRTRILCVSSETPADKLRQFEKCADILVLEKATQTKPIPRQILSYLRARGIERVLIEGGGSVMWDFASLNLIDEYHVTLTPKIVGGASSPTLVDGKGFDPEGILNLRLQQCQILGNELYLIYRKTPTSGH